NPRVISARFRYTPPRTVRNLRQSKPFTPRRRCILSPVRYVRMEAHGGRYRSTKSPDGSTKLTAKTQPCTRSTLHKKLCSHTARASIVLARAGLSRHPPPTAESCRPSSQKPAASPVG